MTEHAAVIFVFFFLAEYGSIVLICVLNTILFLGGYLLDITPFISEVYAILRISIDFFLDFIMVTFSGTNLYDMHFVSNYQINWDIFSYLHEYYTKDIGSLLRVDENSALEGLLSGLIIGFKSCIMIFVFIWVRASFPRIRFDQLMSFSWTILLPIVIAFIVLIPCIVYSFDIIPTNISLL